MINFDTVLIVSASLSCAIFGGGCGFLIAWGKYKEKITNHEQRLSNLNGSHKELIILKSCFNDHLMNANKESERNHAEHQEVFERLRLAERKQEALPGLIVDKVDEKWRNEWLPVLSSHIKAHINKSDN